jgi:transcriptional repressor NrdR
LGFLSTGNPHAIHTFMHNAHRLAELIWRSPVGARMGRSGFSGVERGGCVMRCPYCRHPDSRVVDSREAEDGQLIRRRRSCPECGKRFTTVEEAVLAVVKRSGVTEPFSRAKIIAGVRRACQGRPVDDDALQLLAQRVEETVRARGAAEVPSHEVGLAILGPLRDLDAVAYLRFASVYRSFNSVEDFESEIAALRAEGRTTDKPTVAAGPVAERRPAPGGRAPTGQSPPERPAAAGPGGPVPTPASAALN